MSQERKRVLFLQGLPGGSFWRLRQALRSSGCEVLRVNFNGGDQMDWREPAINFRGRAQDWPGALDRILESNRITDIVLFGDCRPLHRAASPIAKRRGVRVHVFEEGYIRPDWITLELGGVNGHSPLPRDPETYRRLARSLPPPPAAPALEQTFGRRARETFRYYAWSILLGWAFPHYRRHRPWGALTEGSGWIKRLARRGASQRRSAAALRAIDGEPYYLFALQLDSDYQIRVHSPFEGMRPVLEQVVRSFALCAPRGTYLVVKEHPLDNGLINWRKEVTRCAARHGVSDRVVFCDVGDIDAMVRGSQGLVTVNSTTGALGLAAGVPVIALGRAVYDIEGLTHTSGLDSFWRSPMPPDAALYEDFRRVLADQCLIRGGFYSEMGLQLLTQGAVARILREAEVTASDRLAVAAE